MSPSCREIAREPISLSRVPKLPPRERWQFAGFLLDPAGNCGSLASPCFQSMTLGLDKTDPTLRLGETSDPLAVSLNNYLPVWRRYRAAVLVRKLVLTNTNRGPDCELKTENAQSSSEQGKGPGALPNHIHNQ